LRKHRMWGVLAVAPASRSPKGRLSARGSPFWLDDDMLGLGMLTKWAPKTRPYVTRTSQSWTRLACLKSFYLLPRASTFHATRNLTKDQFNLRLHFVFSGLKFLFRLFRSLVIPIIYSLSRGGQSSSYKSERFVVRFESQQLKITSFFFRPLPYLPPSVHGQLLIYGRNQFTVNSSSLFLVFSFCTFTTKA